jgi:hypothetical protein
LKPEWWGSPFVQEEKYQEKPVKREEEEEIIIIIIIIIIIMSQLHYVVKHFSYIPPVLVVWRCTAIQTGVFNTGTGSIRISATYIVCRLCAGYEHLTAEISTAVNQATL